MDPSPVAARIRFCCPERVIHEECKVRFDTDVGLILSNPKAFAKPLMVTFVHSIWISIGAVLYVSVFVPFLRIEQVSSAHQFNVWRRKTAEFGAVIPCTEVN